MENKQEIRLSEIIQIGDSREYKLHLASMSQDGIHPLDEYVTARENWLDWNRWRGSKNDWTRKYIFSFIEYYPQLHIYSVGYLKLNLEITIIMI